MLAGQFGFQADPTGTPWTWGNTEQGPNNEGIAANGSGYTASNPDAPQGTQVAFIQKKGSVAQTLTLEAGMYAVTFYAAQRQQAELDEQALQFQVDGNAVGGIITPASANYQIYTTAAFSVEGGSHTIAFYGVNPQGGDNTALIDLVQVVRVDSFILDASFEAPVVAGAPGKFVPDPPATPWIWGNPKQGPNNEGIAANGSGAVRSGSSRQTWTCKQLTPRMDACSEDWDQCESPYDMLMDHKSLQAFSAVLPIFFGSTDPPANWHAGSHPRFTEIDSWPARQQASNHAAPLRGAVPGRAHHEKQPERPCAARSSAGRRRVPRSRAAKPNRSTVRSMLRRKHCPNLPGLSAPISSGKTIAAPSATAHSGTPSFAAAC